MKDTYMKYTVSIILFLITSSLCYSNPFIGKWDVFSTLNNEDYKFEFFDDGTFILDYCNDYEDVYSSLYFLNEEEETLIMETITMEYEEIDDGKYKLYFMFFEERREDYVYLISRQEKSYE
jgi:hypothetical protein